MTEGKRPGGLTALAVFNFIFAALNLLGVLGMIALFAIFASVEIQNEELAEMKAAFERAGVGMGLFAVLFVLQLVTFLLLLLSGIGYIKQKKVLGRMLGNIYAIIAILTGLCGALMMPSEGGGGFNLGTLLGLVFPVLTLVLLNTTFKDDFPN